MPSTPRDLKKLIPPRRSPNKTKRPRITESQRARFKKEFLEEYRKDYTSLNKTAEKVGFSRQVIYKWTDTDPVFAREFEKLRFIKQGKDEKAWDAIHGRDEEYKEKFLELYADDSYSVARALTEISPELDSHSLKYWQKTDADFNLQYKVLMQKLRPTIAKGVNTRISISSEKVRQRRNKFLGLFIANHFNITTACKQMGIKRCTVKNWCNVDPDFKAELEAAQDEKEDWVEDKLFTLVDEGNMVATIFASKIMLQKKNFGRRHAYIEQPQKIEGHIEHTHKFNQDQLDAMVRGQVVDRKKYEDMLELDDPTVVDAEYTTEETEAI